MLACLPRLALYSRPVAPSTWQTAIVRAWHYHLAKHYPQSRLAIRQACALSLAAGDWRGVYEGFVILQLGRKLGQNIPQYFIGYLQRASQLDKTSKSFVASRLLARINLDQGRIPTGLKLAHASSSLALTLGEYQDALEAARLLLPSPEERAPSEAAMRTWLAIARTSLASGSLPHTLAAARLILDAGIPGPAYSVINQTAARALAKNQPKIVQQALQILETAGRHEDAAVWRTRLATSLTQSAPNHSTLDEK
jgi:hypothetical protein